MAGLVDDSRTVDLTTGGRAGRGDVILTTEIDRRLCYGPEFVRNGTAWAPVATVWIAPARSLIRRLLRPCPARRIS